MHSLVQLLPKASALTNALCSHGIPLYSSWRPSSHCHLSSSAHVPSLCPLLPSFLPLSSLTPLLSLLNTLHLPMCLPYSHTSRSASARIALDRSASVSLSCCASTSFPLCSMRATARSSSLRSSAKRACTQRALHPNRLTLPAYPLPPFHPSNLPTFHPTTFPPFHLPLSYLPLSYRLLPPSSSPTSPAFPSPTFSTSLPYVIEGRGHKLGRPF